MKRHQDEGWYQLTDSPPQNVTRFYDSEFDPRDRPDVTQPTLASMLTLTQAATGQLI